MNEEILNVESNPINATEVEIVTTVQRTEVQSKDMLISKRDRLAEQIGALQTDMAKVQDLIDLLN